MNDLEIRWKRLQAQLTSKAYILRELARDRATSRIPMRILFSEREGWSETIRRKFHLVRDEACFGNLSACALEDYDLVVPLSIEDVVYLDSVRARIPHNPIPTPSLQCIRLCDDKTAFDQCLREHGFDAFLPRSGTGLAYPYVLKKRIDEAGRNSHVIANPEQEAAVSDLLGDPAYFVQECITGSVEYATHVLYRQGRVACSLNIEYGFRGTMPVKGRDKPAYSRLGRCPHLELFAAMLDAIGFEGLCCFNYKQQDGIPRVLEINPRFGRSLCGYFFAFLRNLEPAPRRHGRVAG